MKRSHLIIIAVLLCLAQLIVPLSMIWSKEQTIRKGDSFLFPIEPIDPVHPLRGKYIYLNHKSLRLRSSLKDLHNQQVYLSIIKDSLGIFEVTHMGTKRPQDNTTYVTATVYDWGNEQLNKQHYSTTYDVLFPFHVYYMEETKAPRAEHLYRTRLQDTTSRAYAVVYVYKGDAVITDVIVDSQSIQDWVK